MTCVISDRTRSLAQIRERDRQRILLPPTSGRLWLGLLVAAAGPILVALADQLRPLSLLPSLPYVLVVLIATLAGRMVAGLISVVVSAGLIDYYFFHPLHTLLPLHAEDALALIGFGAISIIVSWVVGWQERARVEAEQARAENARLYQSELAARARLSLVSEVSEMLAASFDYPETYDKLARLVVRSGLAELCLIDLLQEDGSIVRAAAVTADPAKQPAADRVRESYPPSPNGVHPVARIMRGGRPEFLTHVDEQFLRDTTRDEEHLRLMRTIGFESFVTVPLATRGRILGTLTLVSTNPGHRYHEDDVDMAAEIARRAAVRIDNARLYHERDRIARTLQQNLLPPALPVIPGLELAARYEPAGEGMDVGGDFYDVFSSGADTWSVMIGDVCGKGAEAAAVMAVAKYTSRALATERARPSRLLAALNESMLAQVTDERFCTVSLGRVKVNGTAPDGGGTEPAIVGARMTVCSAGHPRPILLGRGGEIRPVGTYGTVLGVFREVDLSDQTVELKVGDAVVFYTDGMEREPTPVEEQVMSALATCAGMSAGEVADTLVSEALSAGRRRRDDLAVVVVRVVG
jgi:serine phosphatase RsbU (regulator of sigma subunit)